MNYREFKHLVPAQAVIKIFVEEGIAFSYSYDKCSNWHRIMSDSAGASFLFAQCDKEIPMEFIRGRHYVS